MQTAPSPTLIDPPHHFRATPDEVELGELVSEGSFGKLHKARWRGTTVAVKKLKQELATDQTAMKDFAAEVKVLMLVRHPNVILYMAAFEGNLDSSQLPFIVLEWLGGGNLYDKIHSQVALGQRELVKFAYDLACGMNFLHNFKPKIIHRDLKPHNLIISSSNELKIGDFGLSRFQEDDGIMTGKTGSFRWMAPEVVRAEKYDEKVDVYSFAMILWEMFSSDVPFSAVSDVQAAGQAAAGARPNLNGSFPPLVVDLIRKCWDNNPASRPAFSYIMEELNHPNFLQIKQVAKSTGKSCCAIN